MQEQDCLSASRILFTLDTLLLDWRIRNYECLGYIKITLGKSTLEKCMRNGQPKGGGAADIMPTSFGLLIPH